MEHIWSPYCLPLHPTSSSFLLPPPHLLIPPSPPLFSPSLNSLSLSLSSSTPLVLDVKFHKQHPDNLFTCSEDGSLWHWDGSQSHTQVHPSVAPRDDGVSTTADTRPWLLGTVGRGKTNICSLLPSNRFPVNSCDVEPSANHMIAVTDGGAMYVVPTLTVC